MKYVRHYQINVRPDATSVELAVAVARHFEAQPVHESATLHKFVKLVEGGVVGYGYGGEPLAKRQRAGARAARAGPGGERALRPARVGEQIAANTGNNAENGSWILAEARAYHADSDMCDISRDARRARSRGVSGGGVGGSTLSLFPLSPFL